VGELGAGGLSLIEETADGITYCVVSCSTLTGTAVGGKDRVVLVESRVKARTGCLGR
jgi:hypothetical protein